jgi:hypothetical protein
LTAQTTVQTRFDASTMHDNPQVAMETGMVDDGSGSIEVHFTVKQRTRIRYLALVDNWLYLCFG